MTASYKIINDATSGKKLVEFTCTRAQWQRLLQHMPLQVANEELSDVRLVQQVIAKYHQKRLFKTSDSGKRKAVDRNMDLLLEATNAFIDLEKLINSDDSLEKVDDIERKLNDALEKVSRFINKLKGNEQLNTKLRDELVQQLEVRHDDIKNNCIKVIGGAQTTLNSMSMANNKDSKRILKAKKDLRKFFSGALEKGAVDCVGAYVNDQLILLSDALAIQQNYNALNNTPLQSIMMDAAIKAGSSIKRMLQRRGRAVQGARYVNTFSRIPGEQIAIAELMSSQSLENREEKVTFSSSWFTNGITDLKTLEKIAYIINDDNLDGSSLKVPERKPGVPLRLEITRFVFGNVGDLIGTAIRLPLQVAGTLIATFIPEFLLSEQKLKDAEKTWANTWHTLSPMRWLKKTNAKFYKPLAENEGLVQELKSHVAPTSQYHGIIDQYLSVSVWRQRIQSTVSKIILSIPNAVGEVGYLFRRPKLLSEQLNPTQQKLIANVNQDIKERLEAVKKQLKKSESKVEDALLLDANEKLEKASQHSSAFATELDDTSAAASMVFAHQAWKPTKFTTIADFPNQIVAALNNDLVDEMFSTAPAVSTLTFSATVVTLGAALTRM